MELLLIEDDDDFRATVRQWMVRHGHGVADASSGAAALQQLTQRRFDVVLVDLLLPDCSGLDLLRRLQADGVEAEALVLTGAATVETAVEAMKLGAFDYLTKPFSLAALEEHCRKAAEHGRLRKSAEQWKAVARRQQPATELVGNSPALKELLRQMERVAPTDKPVLILGETGTGKELAARAIQRRSLRAEQPFVIVNCAALPEPLIESELFGHEKGAFTGAAEARAGLFEVADGGTLFIDEIGELPPALQPKLLRVLEDGSFRRVGSVRERKVDVRLIAATHRDLAAEVRDRRFREDLWYRINVLPITVPPLRERLGDVPLLCQHFLPAGWTIDAAAAAALGRYRWPGNVRQLRNLMDRAAVLADNRTVTLDDLPAELADEPHNGTSAPLDSSLQGVERTHIQAILQECGGNKSQAARVLGIHRRKLYRLLERLAINET